MKKIKNKIVLITGAASGIGRALCLEFAQAGAQVIGTDIDATNLKETQRLVKTNGQEMAIQIYDVSDEAAVQKSKEHILSEYGHIDILINNAGVLLASQSFLSTSQEDWEWIFKINFWSMVFHTRAYLPILLERPKANITNLSSLYGLMGMGEQSPYSTTKFAIRGFSESMHTELLDTNVCVTCVHPGGVDTNVIRNSRTYDPEDTEKEAAFFKQKLAKTTPQKAAQIIMKGIQKNAARVLVGSDAKQVDRLLRWMPVWRIPLFHKLTPFFKRKDN